MPDSPAQTIALARPDQALRPLALLLDFDGTLVEIGQTPDAVAVGTDMAEALGQAALRLEGRIAIVSGRSLEQLRQLLPEAIAGGVIAASHGQELSINGQVQAPPRSPLFTALAARAAGHFGDHPGIVIEEKSFGLGVHYRLAPELRDRAERWALDQAAAHGLIVQQGDMVCELRPGGSDKGDAVRSIMALDRFAGSAPVFIGDDLTDIPAFGAVRALGGRAIAVGPRTAAYADERLESVADVRRRIEGMAA